MEENIQVNSTMERIKNAFSDLDINHYIEKIKSSPAGTIVLYFGASFALGFLFKKYFKFLLGCALIALGVLIILQHNNVINFDWNNFYQLIRYNPAELKFDSLFESTVNWVKANLLIFISGLTGFIIGYKLG